MCAAMQNRRAGEMHSMDMPVHTGGARRVHGVDMPSKQRGSGMGWIEAAAHRGSLGKLLVRRDEDDAEEVVDVHIKRGGRAAAMTDARRSETSTRSLALLLLAARRTRRRWTRRSSWRDGGSCGARFTWPRTWSSSRPWRLWWGEVVCSGTERRRRGAEGSRVRVGEGFLVGDKEGKSGSRWRRGSAQSRVRCMLVRKKKNGGSCLAVFSSFA